MYVLRNDGLRNTYRMVLKKEKKGHPCIGRCPNIGLTNISAAKGKSLKCRLYQRSLSQPWLPEFDPVDTGHASPLLSSSSEGRW